MSWEAESLAAASDLFLTFRGAPGSNADELLPGSTFPG